MRVYAPSGRVAVRVHTATGFTGASVKTRYFHADAQGSMFAVTVQDASATLERQFTYDPWGQQTQRYAAAGEILDRRGYTDHVPRPTGRHSSEAKTMLVDYGLIHMNGRVFDPTVARFASADPFVQDMTDSQSYNRYSYVFNNPLAHTDPSGHFSLKDFVKIVAVVVISVVTYGAASAAATAGMTATAATATTAATYSIGGIAISSGTAGVLAGAAGGAAAGFASGFSGNLLNGGSLGDAFQSGVKGVAAGAIAGGVSGHFGKNWNFKRVAATSVSGGVGSEITGGSFRDRALLAGAVSLVTYGALKMREFTIKQSQIDPKNAQGKSAGFDGDGFKAGGGRFDERPGTAQVESPLGGVQGGQGVIRLPFRRIAYARGSFFDRTVEAYSGVHDWRNDFWSYNPATGNYNPRLSLFGRYLGNAAENTARVMNWVDVPLATPIVAASVAGVYAPNYVQAYEQVRERAAR